MQAIAEYFRGHSTLHVDCVLSNNPRAFVLERAKILNIASFTFTRAEFNQSGMVRDILIKRKIEFIVLAGFMWLVPAYLIELFPRRIVNIHPALLPAYGGKGMYGSFVHEAVIENKEEESGITIHYVNEQYDEGNIIFQAKCPVQASDTPETLAERIHQLEHKYYPEIIEKILLQSL